MRERKPRAGDALRQAAIVRCLERIDRLHMKLEPREPFLTYREAIEAERKTLRLLEQGAR